MLSEIFDRHTRGPFLGAKIAVEDYGGFGGLALVAPKVNALTARPCTEVPEVMVSDWHEVFAITVKVEPPLQTDLKRLRQAIAYLSLCLLYLSPDLVSVVPLCL